MTLPRRELALALVAGGVLVTEICLTKVFSIVLWYHFGFLAVSTALLGFASSGVYLAFRPRLEGAAADAAIARAAATAAATLLLSLWLVTQTRFDVAALVEERTVGSLLALVLWVTLPFFFLGLVIARTLSAFPERVGRLYAFDLVGSGCGCGLAVWLLSLGCSAQTTIATGALLVGLGGLLFAGAQPKPLLAATLGATVPLVVLAATSPEAAFPLLSQPSKPYYPIEHIERYMREQDKGLWARGTVALKSGASLEAEVRNPPQTSADGGSIEVQTDDGPTTLLLDDVAGFTSASWSPYRRWNSMSRVDGFHWPAVYGGIGLWGLSPRYYPDGNGPLPRQKGIAIDAWALTSTMRYSGAPLQPAGDPAVNAARKKLAVLEYLPATTVHRLRPRAERIVCIGAGGGPDLLAAKYFGVRRITGVELNAAVVGAVRGPFAAFAGHLYDHERHPDVEVHVAEGRHFLERSPERYDIVQLSGVDTLSSTEAGAFALSENFLYTLEAFDTYLRHLTPDGVLTLTRWFLPLVEGDHLQLTFELRLLALAREALARAGVAEPGRGIFYLKSANFTVILVKPSAFTAAEDAALRAHCARYGFDLLWSPLQRTERIACMDRTYPNPLQEFMDAADPAAHLAASSFDLTPPTDDRPFFFEMSRFSQILDARHYLNARGLTPHGILVLLLAEVALLGLVFVIWPLRRLAAAQPFAGGGRVRLGALLYFTAIGFGFIAVEIVLSQKFVLFLGHPFYALAVILSSMLVFSGIGAALSAAWPVPRFATLLAALLALATALGLDLVFARALHLDLWARIAISVLMLAPVGLAMGVPFPAGVRVLNDVRPQLIPWAWGINGYTSVLGSVMAVVLGLELGFMAVLFTAAAVYALGVAGYSLMAGPAARAAAS